MTDSLAVVVVDPLSSALHYGTAIQAKKYRAVALISVKKLSVGLRRLQNLNEFQHIIYAQDAVSAIGMLTQFEVCAVLPGSDLGLSLADELSDHYGLVGNWMKTSLSRFDKAHQKSALLEKGISVASGVEVVLRHFNKMQLDHLRYPIVVKPCRGTGSRDVKICANYEEVVGSISTIQYSDEAERRDPRALVEEYVAGEEYFVVTANYGEGSNKLPLCFAVYEKITNHGCPSIYKNIRSLALDDFRAAMAFDYIRNVNDALGFSYGINDVEFKIGPEGPVLIEQNGRMPGAFVPKLIEVCTGIDCYELALDIYLSKEVCSTRKLKFQKHFCVCCLVSERSGVVEGFNGVELVKHLESFHMMSLHVAVGELVGVTVDFLSSWGMVYLIHEDLKILQAESELVHRLLTLQYRA